MSLEQAAREAILGLRHVADEWLPDFAVGTIKRLKDTADSLESALQQQEVPREPVADHTTSGWFAALADARLAARKVGNDWLVSKLDEIHQHLLAASPSTTQQPSVDHALNTTPVVDHATQQQEAGSYPRMAFCPACFVEVLAKEADQQTLDARRYRWLRQADIDMSGLFTLSDDEACFKSGAPLDRAIDAAMLAAAPSTPAREEALRLAGAAGLDPDPEVVGGKEADHG